MGRRAVAGHLHRLGSFSRLILTDLLGIGSSDSAPADNPSMQVRTDGLVSVLDAVGSERASVFSMTESGLSVMLLAATHPQRIRSLLLSSPYANFLRTLDQSFGLPEPELARFNEAFGRNVETGAFVDVLAPSWRNDAARRRWWGRKNASQADPGIGYVRSICSRTPTSASARQYPGADAGVAPIRRSPRTWRPCPGHRRADSGCSTGRVRRRGQRVIRR